MAAFCLQAVRYQRIDALDTAKKVRGGWRGGWRGGGRGGGGGAGHGAGFGGRRRCAGVCSG